MAIGIQKAFGNFYILVAKYAGLARTKTTNAPRALNKHTSKLMDTGFKEKSETVKTNGDESIYRTSNGEINEPMTEGWV